ncbi:MAG: zf-HC2 domain-containing protein [Bacteroidota bacterium]|nr:zf-HC2 domain-containing protein [Bacteroidota bacterium]
METVHRNIILDLLPSYIGGEASAETRALVEAHAQHDPEIARIIRAGAPDITGSSSATQPPDALERKTILRLRRSIRRKMAYVAIATVSILMIPLVAMQFTGEVNWSPADFIVMGMLLIGTGLAYVLISQVSDSRTYHAAVGVAVVTGLLLIWINLAVGIIGSEDNPANALYIGVILIGLVGVGIARLRPRGMARTLFAMAVFQLLVPVIAMIIWRPSLADPPGIAGVFMLNALFAALFAVAGLLFRHSAGDSRD